MPPIDDTVPRDAALVREDSEIALAATPKKLDLGAYTLFAPPPKPSPKIGPRFDTSIDVVASLPRDPNEVMAEWWRHWNFEYSIYGRGINVQKPMPGGGFNLLPLFEWLGNKAKETRPQRRSVSLDGCWRGARRLGSATLAASRLTRSEADAVNSRMTTRRSNSASGNARWRSASAKSQSRKEKSLYGRRSCGLKRHEQAAAGWRSPLVVAIMAATLAGLSNAVIALVNGGLQRQLEDGRAEQARVLEMIKTGDPDKAAGNLEFLLNAGLISDSERATKLREFLAKRVPGGGPALPPQTRAGPYSEGSPVPMTRSRSRPFPRQTRSARPHERWVGFKASARQDTPRPALDSWSRPTSRSQRRIASMTLETARLVLRDGERETAYGVTLPPVDRAPAAGGGSYAVVKVEGSPGTRHGMLRLATGPPVVGQMLAIVFFRGSNQPLTVVGSPDCRVRLVEQDAFYHLCDTGAGSSGAPILSAAGTEVLGVHSQRSEKGGMAARADALVARSRVLQSLR